MEKIKCMKDLAIFSALNPQERNKIGELAVKKIYRKNEFVFREGEGADAIYLIKYGKVRLFKTSENGKEFTLDIIKEEGILGENTFLEDVVHTMNAQALENTFICSCTKGDFETLLQNPKFAMKIIQVLGTMLSSYTEQMASLAFKDVKARIAGAIFRLLKEYGKNSPEGVSIDISLTHQELGNLVNASRVMVTNVLNEFKEKRIITVSEHKIIVLQEKKLFDIASS